MPVKWRYGTGRDSVTLAGPNDMLTRDNVNLLFTGSILYALFPD